MRNMNDPTMAKPLMINFSPDCGVRRNEDPVISMITRTKKNYICKFIPEANSIKRFSLLSHNFVCSLAFFLIL